MTERHGQLNRAQFERSNAGGSRQLPAGSDVPEKSCAFLRPRDQLALMATLLVTVVLIGIWVGTLAVQSSGLATVETMAARNAVPKIDLNKADWTELSALPKIGESTARRIIQFRQEHGPFADLNALTNVKGIGQSTLKAIQPYVAQLPVSGTLVSR